jgi:sugar (pentulose or hexulose) kinase
MMTATCLDLIGADGATVVEGPFALNAQYCDMLRAATGRSVLPQAAQATGTSIGAAMLAGASVKALAADEGSKVLPAKWHAYARAWLDAVNAAGI